MSDCFVDSCTSPRVGIVTNQPDAPPLHPSRAHCAAGVCERHISAGKGHVTRHTHETPVFLTNAECLAKYADNGDGA